MTSASFLVQTGDSSGVEAPSLGIGASAKPLDVRRQEYSEWCLDNGVEYIETCALDEHFDQSKRILLIQTRQLCSDQVLS
jgi:hypothetical protein